MGNKFWPFPVNWRSGFLVESAFQTEIVTSQSGKEQRRAMRSKPRRRIAFSNTVLPDRRQEFEAFMSDAQRSTVYVAERTQSRIAVAELASNAFTVILDATAPWIVEDAYVLLAWGGRSHIGQVASVEGRSFDLTFVTNTQWPKGFRVFPLRPTLMRTDIAGGSPRVDTWVGEVSFDILPGFDLIGDIPQFDYRNYFRGREVFPFPLNWRDGLGLSFVQERELIDAGNGRIQPYYSVVSVAATFSASFMRTSQSAADDLEVFWRRQKGRRGEFFFFVPHRRDFTVESIAAPDALEIRVSGRDAYDTFNEDDSFRAIVVEADGYIFPRMIEDVSLLGSNSVLTVDLGIPAVLSKNTLISKLFLCRFASDILSMDWRTSSIAETKISLQTLIYDSLEDPTSEIEGEGEAWLVDYYGADFFEDTLYGPLQRIMNVIIPAFAESL